MDRLPSQSGSPKSKDKASAPAAAPGKGGKLGFWAAYQLRERASDYLKAIRKQRVYNADLLPEAGLKEVLAYEEDLSTALKQRETALYAPLLERGDQLAEKFFPIRPNDWLRENVEVAFVAIAAALALRAFFLQPFKIPTDSMKPTLFGIQTERVEAAEGAPSFSIPRIGGRFATGEARGLLRLDHPVTVTAITGGSFTPWFEFTEIAFNTGETRRVWIGRDAVVSKLGLREGQSFAAGEPVLSYRSQAGDQVFVDKFSYNFRLPHRGDVFVFRTNGITGIEDDLVRRGVYTSEFYIKRCVGVPGDTLRVVPPFLEINGATEGAAIPFGIRRVDAAKDGYRGYGVLRGQSFLRDPSETYLVAPDTFWAMGDNSYNSLDSRFWGSVPRENVVGTGFFVYWPLGPRWGLIR